MHFESLIKYGIYGYIMQIKVIKAFQQFNVLIQIIIF